MQTPNRMRLGLLAAPLVLVALAGCTTNSGTPEAKLVVDQPTTWAGQKVTFDAVRTTDQENVARYVFDFGDGQSKEVTNANERVEHTYETGGDYNVTLTVYSKDGDDDTDTRVVSVNEREEVSGVVAKAATPLGNVTETEKTEKTFDVNAGADRAAASLNITGQSVMGASTVTVQVVGPDGEVIEEKEATVDPGQTEMVQLEAPLTEAGSHVLRIIAETGTSGIDGELQVRYDSGLAA